MVTVNANEKIYKCSNNEWVEFEKEAENSSDYQYFTDARDGQKYKTVKIGSQTWMAENLNYEVDGSLCYNNSQDNCTKYGRLYQWNAAVNACPKDWHLPTKEEWNILLGFVTQTNIQPYDMVISNAGYVLKSTSDWYDSGNGIDKYGFSVLPAGTRSGGGDFGGVGSDAFFWSASESGGYAYFLRFYCDDEYANWHHNHKDYSFSVRCLRDSN